MAVDAILKELEGLSNPSVKKQNAKNGAGENQFGVKLGDIRIIAKRLKANHELALELWETGNLDARFLAILLMKPAQLSAEEVDGLVRSVNYSWLADWLNSYVVKAHKDKEALRIQWMADGHPSAYRAGWSLTTERVVKSPEGLDLAGLLDRIEAELMDAHELPKWTMNFCLAEIGINYPEYRDRAMAIGERFGVYSDWPVSKGCIPPYVPVWITEMVKRQK